MKKIALAIAAVAMTAAPSLFAGSLDYLSNQSAGFFFNTSKTAATDAADIATYNPAGTALMEKGFYIDLSSQTFLKKYTESNDTLSQDFSQDLPTPALPNFYLVYNLGKVGAGNLAFYGLGGVVAGGGSLDWEDGTVGSFLTAYGGALQTAATLTSATYTTSATGAVSSLEASSVYYAAGIGAAYALLDNKLSASAGLKYVYAKKTGLLNGTMYFNTTTPALGSWSLDIVDDYNLIAQGITPVFGVDYRPAKGLTLGARYEMETSLKFEYDINELSATPSLTNAITSSAAAGVVSNLESTMVDTKQDLPQIISLGAEYQINDAWTVATSANIFLLGLADMDGLEEYFDTGYDVNISVKFSPIEKLALGATCMYTVLGTKDSYWESSSTMLGASANPALDCVTTGLGAQYEVIKNLDVLFSAAWIQYLEATGTLASAYDVSYNKRIINLCIGARYKL